MTPLARQQELVVESLGDEAIVYDLRTDDAHHLDATAAAIWQACDGTQTADEIATHTGVSVEVVEATLLRLSALDIVDGVERVVTRRTALKGAVIAGGLAVGITSLAAPTPAAAASVGGNGAPCTSGAECASGVCESNACVGSFPRGNRKASKTSRDLGSLLGRITNV